VSKFKGFDWTELSKVLKLDLDISDKLLLRETQKILLSAIAHSNEKKVAKLIKKFLQALHKESKRINYSAPLWKGMLKIKSDETLIKHTVELLDSMWT